MNGAFLVRSAPSPIRTWLGSGRMRTEFARLRRLTGRAAREVRGAFGALEVA